MLFTWRKFLILLRANYAFFPFMDCLFLCYVSLFFFFFSVPIICFHFFLYTNTINVANFDIVHRSGGSDYYFFNLFPFIVQTG